MAKQNIQQVKQRFGIIGVSPKIDRAIDIALQVAPTDLSVLITGESGVGKENFPQIIHQYSHRKHGPYFAINCGSIPEGTIDSELFGHEKGSFTGATSTRKGYFEVADGGTLFLDEVGELPLSTQARLLRVLETGEFIKVGSSVIEKSNVRVVAATNLDMTSAIEKGKFREDLFYRLNSVPIRIVPLRDRKSDIILLFKKFSIDCAEKYMMPVITLTDEAINLMKEYNWPGNVRQLKNIAEQISIIEHERVITLEILEKYIPKVESTLPVLASKAKDADYKSFASEREILYQVLFDMKKDINELKRVVNTIMSKSANDSEIDTPLHSAIITQDNTTLTIPLKYEENKKKKRVAKSKSELPDVQDVTDMKELSVSIAKEEKKTLIQALKKHEGKRKATAKELGISERTLYRKIKEFNIDL